MDLLDKINDYLASQSKTQLAKAERVLNLARSPLKVKDNKDYSFTIRVPSESSNTIYEVDIYDDEEDDADELHIACECPAFWDNDDCKHCVAAAKTMQEKLMCDTGKTTLTIVGKPQPAVTDEDGYYYFKMTGIQDHILLKLAGNPGRTLVNNIANRIKPGAVGMPHQCLSYYEKIEENSRY